MSKSSELKFDKKRDFLFLFIGDKERGWIPPDDFRKKIEKLVKEYKLDEVYNIAILPTCVKMEIE